jgi:DNA processing protein
MVGTDETTALIALLRGGREPWQAYAELVEDAGSAVAVLEQEQARLFGGLDLDQAAGLLAGWRAEGIGVISVLDPDYPENLRAVHDRPPIVFVAGRLLARDARAVAVIGSRRASRAGLDTAARIAAHLVEAGYTVCSGLAAGIDAAAHETALARGGRTVAVIGTGVNRFYPAAHERLQRTIAERCAVVSQFLPDAPPSRRSFPMRNAVMSGISLASVIVEASPTSGALTQARLALAHGRPALLVSSLLGQPWARELARRPGVHVVHRPTEITAIVERLTSSEALTA